MDRRTSRLDPRSRSPRVLIFDSCADRSSSRRYRQILWMGHRPILSWAESFFLTPEHERLSRRSYATRAEARQDVARWIDDFYNR